MVAGTIVLAALAGCGGGDSKPSKTPNKPASPAKPRARPFNQPQALAYQVGTPRAEFRKSAGPPLPVDEYALTPDERRTCDYYPFASKPVNYDNVFRFCFKNGKLFSVSTAPSRKVAGPGAGAPSPKKPRNRVRKAR
jgi:hypothetical protein